MGSADQTRDADELTDESKNEVGNRCPLCRRLRFQAIAETLGFSREGEAFLMLVRASVKSSGRGAR